MAKKLPAPTPAESVQLRCEDLGETRSFSLAHAEALLAYQAAKGYSGASHWVPVVADSKEA